MKMVLTATLGLSGSQAAPLPHIPPFKLQVYDQRIAFRGPE